MTYVSGTAERLAVEKRFGVASFRSAIRKYYLSLHPYCFFCGLKLVNENSTIDHILAQSKFKGLEKPKVLCCISCNQMKKARDITEFLLWLHDTEGLIYDAEKAGFHFYKHCPQLSSEFARWAAKEAE